MRDIMNVSMRSWHPHWCHNEYFNFNIQPLCWTWDVGKKEIAKLVEGTTEYLYPKISSYFPNNGTWTLRANDDRCDRSPFVFALITTEGDENDYSSEYFAFDVETKVLPKFEGCKVTRRYMDDPKDICQFINEAKIQQGRPIDYLTIMAHGQPTYNVWKDDVKIDTETLFAANCFDALHPQAKVVLVSCLTGQKVMEGINLAQHIADVTGKQVIAPSTSIMPAEVKVSKNRLLA